MTLANALHAAYAGMIALGIALLIVFRPTARYSTPERRSYYRIQLVTLLGALLGAKFAVLVGDALWPIQPVRDWTALLWSGRSIVGALLFGFLAAELAKPLLRYPLPPNDRFAVALPFSIATGRIGCWLTGCCLGVPMRGGIAMTAADGVVRYPAALVECAFHLLAGIGLAWLYRRGLLQGRLFAAYLAAYGVFRFFTEFLRITPKAFWHLSFYQWLCLAMILAGSVALALRRHAAPSRFPPQEPAST